MNIATCAAKLFTYFSPEEREIPDNEEYPGRNSAVLEAMNFALQDLFGKGKKWVRSCERGAVLNPPIVIPITVTNGSTAATIQTGDWLAWFAGCSIVIAGAEVDNQITNDSASVILKFPYSGTTGVQQATVYHDSIEIGSDVLEVHDPIKMNGQPLSVLASPLGMDSAPRNTEDFGFHKSSSFSEFPSVSSTGTPRGYSMESWSPSSTSPPRNRMRFVPAPKEASFIEYSGMLCPPRILSLSSVDALPVPYNFIESIYLPITVKKLRGCPFWRGLVGEDEVESGYKNALALLGEGDPSKAKGFRFTSIF